MSAFFVTGAGTEIGKTYVACALLRALRAKGVPCAAFKPVVSGFDEHDVASSDPARLLAALGEPAAPELIERMSPWRFRAPLAPPRAARAEGASLAFDDIERFCRERMAEMQEGILLIEGAGGIMAPLTDATTSLDLIVALKAPVVFVAGTYLGAVSHALSGLDVLLSRDVEIASLVLSESQASMGVEETRDMILALSPALPIAMAPRCAADATWSDALAQALRVKVKA